MRRCIVFLIDSFVGPWAGTENQLWQLIRGLDTSEYEPYLLVLRHTEFSHGIQAPPCPIIEVRINKLVSLNGLTGLWRLINLLRRLDAKIVHAFFQDSSLIGPLAAKAAGARFVAGRRDMGIWYTRKNLRLLRMLAPLVDQVVANSQAVAELVCVKERMPYSRVTVIYNGIDLAKRDDTGSATVIEKLPQGAQIIGIVANLKPVKRHADIIRALANVRQAAPAAHLVVVGDGPLKTQLVDLAGSVGVSGQTHFLGRIDQPSGIIRQFTVGVICSESEGLSNALMEYLKEGKPVVCTDVGGNPELVNEGENGYLYPLGNQNLLIDRIVRLLTDNGLRERMGESARDSIRAYTWTRMVESHVELYDSILAEASGSTG